MAEPTINFGTTSKFGTQTGWHAQAPSVDVASTRATAMDNIGNEVAANLHDETTTVSQEFVAASATVAPTVPANIGDYLGTYIVTGISLTTDATAHVKMSLTGHNHTENAHADATLNEVAHLITLSKAFGAIDFLDGTAGANADMKSSTCNVTCQHKDEVDADGDHLIGENFGPKITVTVVWNGVPTTPAGAGWDKVSVSTAEDPSGFLTTTVNAEKSLAFS